MKQIKVQKDYLYINVITKNKKMQGLCLVWSKSSEGRCSCDEAVSGVGGGATLSACL